MPVLTRSKLRLLRSDEDLTRTTEGSKKLVDITNKESKLTKISKKVKSKAKKEMNVVEQVTMEVPQMVAGRKRKASQNTNPVENQNEVTDDAKKSKPSKLSQVESSGSVESQQPARNLSDEHAEFVEMMRRIKKMHDNGFKDVAERLKLDPIPSCLFNLKKCQEYHNPKNTIKFISNTTKTTILDALCIDARLWRFIHNIRYNIIGLNIFPGSDVLSKVLEKILKLSPNKEFTTAFMLREFHSLFCDIMDKFPPCHIRHQYLKVFNTKINFEGIREEKILLPTILDQLSELIFDRNDINMTQRKINDDVAYNFEAWDQYQQNETFTTFSHVERFERLFLVLDLAVRVLEHDASIFIIKYSYKFSTAISNHLLKPLICSVIWKDESDSVIVINSMIKQLINIFVAMVALQYPPDKIKIVSRLLTLVSHVVNLYEYPNDTFQYPIYQNYSIDFAREIQRSIENSRYYSMHLHQLVVESIRSPLVQMLLMNFMVNKVTGKNQSISLSIALNSILKNEMENFADLPRTKFEKRKERYPKYIDTKKEKRCNIVQSDYLQMMLSYIKAVDNYYSISNATAAYLRKNEPQISQAIKVSPTVEDINTVLSSKVILRKVDLKFNKMVHIRFTKETCTFYREEIKNLLILNQNVKYWHGKYGSKFDGWVEFVKKVEAKIAG